MPNMSYCRFENTVNDLQDCYDSMHEKLEEGFEKDARKRFIRLCVDIAEDYGDELD